MVFVTEVLKKPCFRENPFLVIRGSILVIFGCPGNGSSAVRCLGDRLEN